MLDRKTLLFYICCFLLLSRFGNPQVTPSDGATAPSAKALVAANAPTITGESGAPPDPNAAASTLNPGDTSPGPIVSTTDTGSVPAPTPQPGPTSVNVAPDGTQTTVTGVVDTNTGNTNAGGDGTASGAGCELQIDPATGIAIPGKCKMAVDLVVPPDGVVTTPGTGEIGPGVQTAPDAIVDGLPRDGLATAPDILGVPEGVIPVPDPIGPVPPTPVTPTPVTPGLTPAVQAGVGVAAGLAGLALLAAPLALIGLNKKPKPLVIAGDIRHTGTTHFLGTPRTRKPVHLGVGKHANNRRNSNLRKKSILITKKVKILPPSLNRVVKSVPPLIKTVRQWTISTYPTLARINQCNKRLSPPSSPAESLQFSSQVSEEEEEESRSDVSRITEETKDRVKKRKKRYPSGPRPRDQSERSRDMEELKALIEQILLRIKELQSQRHQPISDINSLYLKLEQLERELGNMRQQQRQDGRDNNYMMGKLDALLDLVGGLKCLGCHHHYQEPSTSTRTFHRYNFPNLKKIIVPRDKRPKVTRTRRQVSQEPIQEEEEPEITPEVGVPVVPEGEGQIPELLKDTRDALNKFWLQINQFNERERQPRTDPVTPGMLKEIIQKITDLQGRDPTDKIKQIIKDWKDQQSTSENTYQLFKELLIQNDELVKLIIERTEPKQQLVRETVVTPEVQQAPTLPLTQQQLQDVWDPDNMDDIEESEQEEELEYEPEGTIPRIMKPSNIITDRKPGDWETATTFFKDKCEAIVYDSESIQGRYDISEEEEQMELSMSVILDYSRDQRKRGKDQFKQVLAWSKGRKPISRYSLGEPVFYGHRRPQRPVEVPKQPTRIPQVPIKTQTTDTSTQTIVIEKQPFVIQARLMGPRYRQRAGYYRYGPLTTEEQGSTIYQPYWKTYERVEEPQKPIVRRVTNIEESVKWTDLSYMALPPFRWSDPRPQQWPKDIPAVVQMSKKWTRVGADWTPICNTYSSFMYLKNLLPPTITTRTRTSTTTRSLPPLPRPTYTITKIQPRPSINLYNWRQHTDQVPQVPAAYIYQSRMRQGRPGHPSYPSQPSTYTGSWSKQPPLQPSPQPPQFSMSFPSSPQPLIPGDIYWQPSQPQFDPQYPYPPGGLHPLPGYTTTTSHFSSLPSQPQPQPQPQPRTKFSSFTSTTQRPGQPGWRTQPYTSSYKLPPPIRDTSKPIFHPGRRPQPKKFTGDSDSQPQPDTSKQIPRRPIVQTLRSSLIPNLPGLDSIFPSQRPGEIDPFPPISFQMHLLGTHSDPQNLQDPQHRQPSLFDNAPLPNTNDNDPRPVHRHPNLPDPSDSRFPQKPTQLSSIVQPLPQPPTTTVHTRPPHNKKRKQPVSEIAQESVRRRLDIPKFNDSEDESD